MGLSWRNILRNECIDVANGGDQVVGINRGVNIFQFTNICTCSGKGAVALDEDVAWEVSSPVGISSSMVALLVTDPAAVSIM